jgi:subtilisin family serine protease
MRKPKQTTKQRSFRKPRLEKMEDRLVMAADVDPAIQIDDLIEAEVEAAVGQQAMSLAAANAFTGQNAVVQNYGFTGAGQTVAIIDSGVAWNHPALGGGFGVGHTIVGGWDFAENDANPYDDGPMGSHGTHVAGIIGAESESNSGVATGADIVSLRVFDDEGSGYFSWVEQALQWVHDNRNSFANPITTVNLSLGAEWNANTVPSWATLENEFAQLESDGIFISVAAGNSFESYNAAGLSYPAASSHVVPVGAVDASGNLAYFSQRNERIIAAPGVSITSTVPDYVGNVNGRMDDWASYSGTSMAAPYLAGASTLIREALQFAGQKNITQNAIYTVMYNSADWIYDSVTAHSYARLDLQAAIGSIMGTDDYGSTAAAASNLGSLNGTHSVAGKIGSLQDVDYFRFNAAASGTVTITGNFTDMQPNWVLNGGGGTVGKGGNSFTFNVQQGQSYAFGIAANDTLGKYSLGIKLQTSEISATQLGAITQKTLGNVRLPSADTWYSLTSTRAGILTVEALFSHAAGNVDLQLYDANMKLLASSTSRTNNERIDFDAMAGQAFFLKASGSNSNVTLRLTNLVGTAGTKVDVRGTSGADNIALRAGSTFKLDINGVAYSFASSDFKRFSIDAGKGTDTVTVYGGTGNESGSLRVGSLDFYGSGSQVYTAAVRNAENIRVYSGGGLDTIGMNDSAGSDTFSGYSSYARLFGAGFSNVAYGFRQVAAYASNGSLDRANLVGGASSDTLFAAPTGSTLYGSNYSNSVSGFGKVYVYGGGGNDRATVYGSAGSDKLIGRPGGCEFSAGSVYFNVSAFPNIVVNGNGGKDTATLYGSAGDDIFQASFGNAVLAGAGYQTQLSAFRVLTVYASGGNDTSRLYDSSREETLTATPESTRFVNSVYDYTVKGFDSVVVYSRAHNDRAVLYGSQGDDSYKGTSTGGRLTGPGYSIDVESFKSIVVNGQGGNDFAQLIGTSGKETYTSTPQGSQFVGVGFLHNVSAFERTNIYSQGGADKAVFRDDKNYREVFTAASTQASIAGKGYRNYAYGFSNVEATSTGGGDRARFYDLAGYDKLAVAGKVATLSGDDYYVSARGFESVFAYGAAIAEKDSSSKKATDFYFSLVGNW